MLGKNVKFREDTSLQKGKMVLKELRSRFQTKMMMMVIIKIKLK